MHILAIHPGHNSTAALLEDGYITAVLSQEKIDNIKNSAAFPADAVQAILTQRNLTNEDIDEVVIASKEVFPARCYEYLFEPDNQIKHTPQVRLAKSLENGLTGQLIPWLFQSLREKNYQNLLAEGMQELKQNLEVMHLAHKPMYHIDHHTCHARAAFHSLDDCHGTQPGLIFTLDGSGDGLCATVTQVGPNGYWQQLAKTPARASLGGIYSNTTRFLGMKILEHEYKVMGLAAYCKGYHLSTYKRIFEPIIDLDPQNPLQFVAQVNASNFYNYLCQYAVGERFDNVAGAVQHLLEERVTAWIKTAIEQTGIRRIFTGGGSFMNVKVNKCIQEMPEVETVHFMPSCGDESLAIGAAYERSLSRGLAPQPLENLYLGTDYSQQILNEFIQANRLDETYLVTKLENIEETIAELLVRGKVVARFSGRCEWGARSLGNRAILAHPSYMESFYTVNDLIKARDFWMPFAPTILDTAAARYLVNYNEKKAAAPHMITAFQATPLAVKELRAAMHQGDQTLRPQILTKVANPSYYQLIRAFERNTGVGAVLNTSFNLHGYPLVANPQQAMMTLEKSGLQHLALGNFLIQKR